MGAQKDSAPSLGTSGAFKDQDGPRPEWFSAHSKTGFLNSEVFTKKFIPVLFLGGARGNFGRSAPNCSCFICAFNNAVERKASQKETWDEYQRAEFV